MRVGLIDSLVSFITMIACNGSVRLLKAVDMKAFLTSFFLCRSAASSPPKHTFAVNEGEQSLKSRLS